MEKQGAKGARLRTGRILLGFLFLLNPYFSILDLLPDCIGYALLLSGIGDLIWALPSLTDARANLLKLTLLSALRGLAFPIVASVPSSEGPTMALLFVTCFSVMELVFLWPLLRQIKDALSYLSVSLGGENPAERYPAVRLRLFSVMKVACNLLPELCVLGVNEDGYIDSVTDSMSRRYLQLRSALTALLFLVMLIFSLIALIGVIRWLGRIKRNARLLDEAKEYALAHPEKAGKRTLRIAASSIWVMLFALILLFSFRIDSKIFVPTFASGILLWIAYRLLARILPQARGEGKWALGYALLAFANGISQLLFIEQYHAAGVAPGRGIEWFWINVALAALVGIGTVYLVFRLHRVLITLVKERGFAPVEQALVRMAAQAENQKRALCMRIRLLAVFAVLPALCEPLEAATLFTVFGPDAEHAFPIWGVFVAIRVLWLVFAGILLGQIKECIAERVRDMAE